MSIPAVRGEMRILEPGVNPSSGMSTAKKVGAAVGSVFVAIAIVAVGVPVGLTVIAAAVVVCAAAAALSPFLLAAGATSSAVRSFFAERAAAKRERDREAEIEPFSYSTSCIESFSLTSPSFYSVEPDERPLLTPSPIAELPTPPAPLEVQSPPVDGVAEVVELTEEESVDADLDALDRAPAAEIAPPVAPFEAPVTEEVPVEIDDAPAPVVGREEPRQAQAGGELVVRPGIGDQIAETAFRTALCGVLISGIALYYGYRGAAWTGRNTFWAGRVVLVDAPLAGLGVAGRAGQTALSGAGWVASGLAARAAALGSAALSGATWAVQTTAEAVSLIDG